MVVQSPFGGGLVPFESNIDTGSCCRLDLRSRDLGYLYVGEQMALRMEPGAPYSNAEQQFSTGETSAAWALIRSKLWRAIIDGTTPTLLLTTHELEAMRSAANGPNRDSYQIVSFEEQLDEAKELTFTKKCNETLINIQSLWRKTGKPFVLPYIGFDNRYNISWADRGTPESGMAYGCNAQDAILVYQHLISDDLVDQQIYNNINAFFSLSPRGLIEVERLARERESNPEETTKLKTLITHGHDEANVLRLKNFLVHKLGLPEPVVMHERTVPGATLPEKFEELARSVDCVIAIMSADDVGKAKSDPDYNERCRQNVIVEIGWFWGKLGRKYILLLKEQKVEMPTDFQGLEYIPFISSVDEAAEKVRDFFRAHGADIA